MRNLAIALLKFKFTNAILITSMFMVSGCGFFGTKQYSLTESPWNDYNGVIQLTNGDSLKGLIMFNSPTEMQPDYVGYFTHFRQKPKVVTCNEIKSVKIFKNASRTNYVMYQNFHYKTCLWRLVRERNGNRLYDDIRDPNFQLPGKYIIRRMILVTSDNQIIPITTPIKSFLHDNRTKSILKSFINKRYKTNHKKKDFKDEADMMDFILSYGLAPPASSAAK